MLQAKEEIELAVFPSAASLDALKADRARRVKSLIS